MEHKRQKFVNFRNIAFTAFMGAIVIVIQLIVGAPFAAFPKLLAFLTTGLGLILIGPLFVLLMKKAPYIGSAFLLATIIGLFFLAMGSPITLIVYAIGGVVCELILLTDKKRSIITIGIAYAVLALFFFLGSYMTYWLMSDQVEAQMVAQNMSPELMESYLTLYNSALLLSLAGLNAIACSVLGTFLGRKLFKKHFVPAGIVQDEE